MNKISIITLTVVLTIFLILSGIFLTSSYSILSLHDMAIAMEDTKTPAITIPNTNQKYFNKWQCFNIKKIKITDAEIEYGTKRNVPLIDVKDDEQLFQFNVDPVIRWNKDAVIKKWSDLIQNQKTICIFSAYLQTDPDKTSVWYIKMLKTKKGYWDIADSEGLIL
jgi:hypothetical protein